MTTGKIALIICSIVLLLAAAGLFHTLHKSQLDLTNDRDEKTLAAAYREGRFQNGLSERFGLTSGIFDAFTSDLDEMKRIGRIRVLTTNTYFNFFTYRGEHHGFEYSLMEEFEKFLNAGVGRGDLKVEMYYVPLPYDLLIPALKEGYGDVVAANMTIHAERRKEVDFSDPYQWGIKEVLVTHRGVKNVDSLASLSGRKIYVRKSSSYHMSLVELNQRFDAMDLPPVEIITLPGIVQTADILEMVSAGAIPMTVADDHMAVAARDLLPDITVHDDIVFNDDVRYGWMVRKNNPGLRAGLNRFIKTIKKGTLKGNVYFQQYVEGNPWRDYALKHEDFDECCRFIPLFKKYGKKFGINWMLLAAQAYQESRFDPDALSPAGAVGLMQILPATALEMGIEHINRPDNNIQAGVKYLRWIMDTYFTDQGISDDDRIRFTLAAYNAGPRKIMRSRQVTADMGHDPSRWFGHGELGAMKAIGPEPVNYVRSVNKNYLAFLLSKVLSDFKQQRLDNIMDLSDTGKE